MTNQLEQVRVAASTRRFLISWRVFVAYLATGLLVDLAVPAELTSEQLPSIAVVAGLIALWLFNRRHAVWVERDASGIRVLTRRARWEDLSRGRTRWGGEVLVEYQVCAAVAYSPTAYAWWRADRTLTIDGDSYAVHPEGRKLAAGLADDDRWVASRTTISHH